MASTSSTLKFSPRSLKKSLAFLRLQNSFVNGAFFCDDLVHPLLDLGEIVGMERVLLGEVVIEAVLDHRADRHLRLRPQRLHRLRHHVRGVVPDELERFRVGAGDEFDLGVGGDRIGEVGELAVEAHGHRALGERGRDRLGDLEPRRPRFDRAARAVGKRQRNVGHPSLLSLAAYQCSVSWSGYMLRRAHEVKSAPSRQRP